MWGQRTAAPLPWPLMTFHRDREDHVINTFVLYSMSHPICKETKCWRTETFVFTIHLKGSDGGRNTTRYRRPGLLSRRHLIAACRDNADWDDQTSLFLSTCLAHPIKTTQVRFSLFNVLTTFSWTSLSSSAVVIAQTSYSHNRPRHF